MAPRCVWGELLWQRGSAAQPWPYAAAAAAWARRCAGGGAATDGPAPRRRRAEGPRTGAPGGLRQVGDFGDDIADMVQSVAALEEGRRALRKPSALAAAATARVPFGAAACACRAPRAPQPSCAEAEQQSALQCPVEGAAAWSGATAEGCVHAASMRALR